MQNDIYVEIDRAKSLADEPTKGHNRWHPEVEPVASVAPGQVVGIETRDAFDGQIGPSSTAQSVGECNLDLVHPLTGPIFVEGAEPGDILEVRVLEVTPEPFGFTVQVPGFGFLREEFTRPYIVRWDIQDGQARSQDLPGVCLPGAPFMGVIVMRLHWNLCRESKKESAHWRKKVDLYSCQILHQLFRKRKGSQELR